ncbi:enolase [Cardiosporidium cionae]|uniref:Enolase n=1 Tax=Cardiosporidium cionae TaxID=476202 RepID=A0ABQ7JBU5_9APIC|nr:enolase [Cardiosporidium cionae]|eukprot:KAF8821441.1 enolase [Cardiosporidium cionae]
MSTIQRIAAREILDCHGFPCVEVDVVTNDGIFRASAPNGRFSISSFEPKEIHDGDINRYLGKGVLKAIKNIEEEIAPTLKGMDPTEQEKIDTQHLDGAKNEWGYTKENLGANSILAVSMAVCRAGASAKNLPLYKYIATLGKYTTTKMAIPIPVRVNSPVYYYNILTFTIVHGGWNVENKLAYESFMILPIGATSFKEALKMGFEVYNQCKKVIKRKYGISATSVTRDGSFCKLPFHDNEEVLSLLLQAIEKLNLKKKIAIAINAAASEFHYIMKKFYNLRFKFSSKEKSNSKLSSEELALHYKTSCGNFPILAIEDPFGSTDWRSFTNITNQLGNEIKIVGEDLLVSNLKRLALAIDRKACNAISLKLSQLGTITEAIEICALAHSHNFGISISYSPGETTDSFIADLAVGVCAGCNLHFEKIPNKYIYFVVTDRIKSGAPCRSEYTSKYNQLLRIEEDLDGNSTFAGKNFPKVT